MRLLKTLPVLVALVGAAGCHREKGGPSNHLKTHPTPPPNSVSHEEPGVVDSSSPPNSVSHEEPGVVDSSSPPNSVLHEELDAVNSYRQLVDWRLSGDSEQVPIEANQKETEEPYIVVAFKSVLIKGPNGTVTFGFNRDSTFKHGHIDPTKSQIFHFVKAYKAGVTLEEIIKALEECGIKVLEKKEYPSTYADFGPIVAFKVETDWNTLEPLMHRTLNFKDQVKN